MRLQWSNSWSSLGRRMIGALRLDGATYREVAHDPGALAQSVAVILLGSVASAIVFLIDGDTPGLSNDVD